MEDNDPFAFIVARCTYSSSVDEIFKRLSFAGQGQPYLGYESPELRHPPMFPPAAAVVSPRIPTLVEQPPALLDARVSPRIPTPVEEPSPTQRFGASTSEARIPTPVEESSPTQRFGASTSEAWIPTPVEEPSPTQRFGASTSEARIPTPSANQRFGALTGDVDESIRVSSGMPTPVEEASPNKRVRASTSQVGECSRKRKMEIPKDVDIITIEDSDSDEADEVEEMNETEEDGECIVMSVLRALASEQRQERKARAHLGLVGDGVRDFLETAMHRGVTFSKPKWWMERDMA